MVFNTFVVDDVNNGRTLRDVMKNPMKISRRLSIALKKTCGICVNGMKVNVDTIVFKDDIIELFLPDEEKNVEPQKMDIDILYEDEWVLVVNKPGDIVVHPTFNHPDNTLANGVAYYYELHSINQKVRPVNRLDKGTSGIVVFAKNQYSHELLSRQLHDKTLYKEYLGLVLGTPQSDSGSINLPIARAENSLIERTVSETGAPSVTHYNIVKRYVGYTLMRFVLETGRTHQIRVHCLHSGFPLVGDSLYGNVGCELISRQALHAYKVRFITPTSDIPIQVDCPIPNDIDNAINFVSSL